MIGRSDKNGPQGNGISLDKSFTLNTTDRHAIAVRTAQTGANGIGVAYEKAHTLDGANGQAVAYKNFAHSGFGEYQEGVGTLLASGGDLGGGSEIIICENHASDSLQTWVRSNG
jgi:DNA (cytosine-5)-methyltransferase 1